MRVMLLGASGQLGTALQASLTNADITLFPLTRAQLDITSQAQLSTQFELIEPEVVINASAYTAVDKAEAEHERAFAINCQGPRQLAILSTQVNCRIIHVSTDFVFDGIQSSPYLTDDVANPINVYGQSKLEGEHALLEHAESLTTIVRTSWLYSSTHPCFYASMLHLMKSKPKLGVVADQIGSPTSVYSLAQLISKAMSKKDSNGIYHWSDAGVASWYDFAVAIQTQAFDAGLLNRKIDIAPLKTEQYPTPAKRPRYSVMDKTATYNQFEMNPVHWQVELQKVIDASKLSES